jgi:hypothetical protein
VTVEHFAANSSVNVSCRDSANPEGFYAFALATDSAGDGFTQSYCYSGDGPEYWVVVNESVQSNHVVWAASGGAGVPGGGSPGGGGSSGGSSGGSGGGTGGKGSTAPGSDTCLQYHGSRIADSGSVAASLFGHYVLGLGDPVVIDWSYFSNNRSFVAEATSLGIGQFESTWQAPAGTDMRYALGHFTIERDTADCYLVYDVYDFSAGSVYFPFWAISIDGARSFDIHASGKL